MICQECKKQGNTSKVYGGNTGFVTAMAVHSYYDEEGREHFHDPNTTTINYHSSNGHKWLESHKGLCWCGWPNNKENVT